MSLKIKIIYNTIYDPVKYTLLVIINTRLYLFSALMQVSYKQITVATYGN